MGLQNQHRPDMRLQENTSSDTVTSRHTPIYCADKVLLGAAKLTDANIPSKQQTTPCMHTSVEGSRLSYHIHGRSVQRPPAHLFQARALISHILYQKRYSEPRRGSVPSTFKSPRTASARISLFVTAVRISTNPRSDLGLAWIQPPQETPRITFNEDGAPSA